MNANKTPSTAAQIALWLSKKASDAEMTEAALCVKAGVSASYLSKAKKGIAEIPEKKLCEFLDALQLPYSAPFEDLSIPPPPWLESKLMGSLFGVGNEPRKLRFPYAETVPDHTWPVLAKERLLSQFNVELVPERLSLGEFERRMAEVDRDKADTAVVLPQDWMSHGHKYYEKFTPIACSHIYHGYSLIGRRDGRIRALEKSPDAPNGATDPGTLCALVAELRYAGIFDEKDNRGTIVFVDKAAEVFVGCLVEVATKIDRRGMKTLNGFTLTTGHLPVPPDDPTFLDSFSRGGLHHCDFVVGHALSLALALESGSRYQVFADYHHLLSTAAQLPSQEEKDAARICIEKLGQPVYLALNIGKHSKLSERTLCQRLCAAAHQIGRDMFSPLTSAACRDLATILSTRLRTPVSTKALKDAWQRSYSFMGMELAASYLESAKPPASVNLDFVKDITASLIASKARFDTSKNKHPRPSAAMDKAQKHYDNGNFPDACAALGL